MRATRIRGLFLLLVLTACRRSGQEAALITMASPQYREVVQRNAENRASLRVRGLVRGRAPTRVEARFVLMPGGSGRPTQWIAIPVGFGIFDRRFDGTVDVEAGGWYSLEVRAWNGSELLASAKVDKVGVGEVFIIAGQSNAANSGSVRMIPAEDRVSTWNRRWWQWAGDPQPIASGRGGSPWPLLGDRLVRRLRVPVGFIVVAIGGSPVHEWRRWATWRKHGECYKLFREALRAPRLAGEGAPPARAVLWHQGETNTLLGTGAREYWEELGRVIAQSRRDMGFAVPWLVAGAAYFGPDYRKNEAAIREGQRTVCDGKLTFEGPTTDDMLDGFRTGVHFNERGLREHARRWNVSLMSTVLSGVPPVR